MLCIEGRSCPYVGVALLVSEDSLVVSYRDGDVLSVRIGSYLLRAFDNATCDYICCIRSIGNLSDTVLEVLPDAFVVLVELRDDVGAVECLLIGLTAAETVCRRHLMSTCIVACIARERSA